MLSGVDHLGTPMHMRFIDAALEFLGAVPGAWSSRRRPGWARSQPRVLLSPSRRRPPRR